MSRNIKPTNSREIITFSKDFVISPVSRHFLYSKVSRNSKTTKSLEIMTFQEILLFLLFQDTFGKGWKIRSSEGWNGGRLEGQKVGRLESSSNERVLSFPKVIIPDRAERRRREARRV